MKAEKKVIKRIDLTVAQIAFIERDNPQFRERHIGSGKSREPLNQDRFYVGKIKGVGKLCLHTLIDTYSKLCVWFSAHEQKSGRSGRRAAQ